MRHVIVGSGPAGIFAAEAIRRRDERSALTLLTADETIARSPVMLTYWLGEKLGAERLSIRDEGWAERKKVEVMLGRRATSLDIQRRRLILAGGEEVAFDRLLIATGAEPILLPIPGANLRGVHSLRRFSDVQAIVRAAGSPLPVLILGGGFIGLKLAAHLRERGIEAVILEKEPKLAPRALDRRGSAIIAALLRQHGIRVETKTEVKEILGEDGRVSGARLADGRVLSGQSVVQAVGVRPNTEFLQGSGIELQRGGIPVAASMETSAAGIYAAGDVALSSDGIAGQRVNHATWPAASRQGTVAGTNMAGGRLICADNLPLNALNLFGTPMLLAGAGAEEETEQALVDERDGGYRKLVLREGRLVGFILIGEVSSAGFWLRLIKKREIIPDPRKLLEGLGGEDTLPRGMGPRVIAEFGSRNAD